MSRHYFIPGRRRSDYGQLIRVSRLPLDMDALAMALQLANLVERSTDVSCIDGRTPNGDRFYNGERMPGKRPVAGWLRARVEGELWSACVR